MMYRRDFLENDGGIEFIDNLYVKEHPFYESGQTEYYQAKINNVPLVLEMIYVDGVLRETLVDLFPHYSGQ